MKRKIGIMGGTFNPIHKGHIEIAKKAYEEYGLENVIFIPSGNPYFKEDVLDKNLRFEMTKAAVSEYPFFSVSDIEVIREGNSYSYETIECLKDMAPEADLYFIVGADSVLKMEEWKFPERIFSGAVILAAFRPGNDRNKVIEKIEEYKEKYNARIFLLEMEENDISSTKIREYVNRGQDISNLVSKEVYEFIMLNKLYR